MGASRLRVKEKSCRPQSKEPYFLSKFNVCLFDNFQKLINAPITPPSIKSTKRPVLSQYRKTIHIENPTRCTSQQPFTHSKPEAASAVLGSWWWAVCRPKHVELQHKYEIKFWYTVASCWVFLYELNYDVRIHKHQAIEIRHFAKGVRSNKTASHKYQNRLK